MSYARTGKPHKRIEGLVVESGIPLPENYEGKVGEKKRPKSKKRAPLFPFAEMNPGDSLFVPGEKTGEWAHDSMKKYARYHGKLFIARNVEGGLRCWRVS